ncbi:MAG: hypothetical protein FWF60_01655, partial [Oscillospiraceae bacterium]|nr:hypothetical protein [Oscillospiraceae bacterium]
MFEGGVEDGSDYSFNTDGVLDVDLGIVNNTGVPMTYTIKFWNGVALQDRLGKDGTIADNNQFVDPAVVFDPSGPYAPTVSGYTTAFVARDREVYDYFNMGLEGHEAHPLPFLFYLDAKGSTASTYYGGIGTMGDPDPARPPWNPGTQPLPIADNTTSIRFYRSPGGGLNSPNFRTGPFKPFKAQGNVQNNSIHFWGAPGDYDSCSGSLAAAAGTKDEYTFHYGWPYERNSDGLPSAFNFSKYPKMNFFSSGGMLPASIGYYDYYWDLVDTAIGGLVMDINATFYTIYTGGLGARLLRYFYNNSAGTPSTLGADSAVYDVGGVALRYWVKYEIVATVIPQLQVGFYTNEALTAKIDTWVVNPGITLDDPAFPYPALPTAPPKDADGNDFLYWAYKNGANWVKVPDDYLFDTAGTTLNTAGTLYEEIKLRAIYDTAVTPPGPPVNVVVMVNVGTPDEDTIYTWLSSSGVPLHLPDVPPKAGSTPVGWFFEYTDPNDGRKKKVRVQPDGTGVDFTDPESYGLAANANGIYTFLLTPEYTPVVTPGPELPSWLLPVGGVVLFGAGGLTIGGLTLPWLLALPL